MEKITRRLKGGLRLNQAIVLLICAFAIKHPVRADALRIVGSATVNLPVAEAAQILRAEQGMEIQISTSGGSAASIGAIGEGSAEIGMMTRSLTAEDRADYPEINYTEIQIGEQVVALGVAQDVWEGGVHELTPAQVRGIYEGKISDWHEVGGANGKIVFFNREDGRGVWELFAQWLYGETKKAPLGHFPTVATDEEARNTIEFTNGSMSQLSPLFLDGKRSSALAIKNDDGSATAPTPENVVAKKYPMIRPLLLVVNDKPTAKVKAVVDFMLGPRGQALIKKHGFFTLEMLKPATAK